MNIQQAMSHFIDDLSLAPNTARSYRNGINCFGLYLAENKIDLSSPIVTLTVDHFIYFLPWMDRKYSKQTSGVYGAAVKAFLNWLVMARVLAPDYQDSIRLKMSSVRSHRRHQDKLPRWPQKDDITRLLAAVRLLDESPRRERNIAFLEFLVSTGCRVSEATHLTVGEIDISQRTTIVTGKGAKERHVFLSQVAADAIVSYWTIRGSRKITDPAFARHDLGATHKPLSRMTTQTARDIVSAVAVKAGIDPSKFTPHYFRHAFAIKVLSETGNLALAQDLLGHSDPKSTRVYAKIYPEDLKDAHDKIFG